MHLYYCAGNINIYQYPVLIMVATSSISSHMYETYETYRIILLRDSQMMLIKGRGKDLEVCFKVYISDVLGL